MPVYARGMDSVEGDANCRVAAPQVSSYLQVVVRGWWLVGLIIVGGIRVRGTSKKKVSSSTKLQKLR